MQKNKLPNLQFRSLIGKLAKSHIFVRNFACLMGILTLFFLFFSLIIFKQSKDILLNEFTDNSQYQLEKTAEAIDNHLTNIQYVAAALDVNHMVQAFFSYEHPERFYQNYYSQLQETLKSFVNGFPSIDSIYLYSDCSNMVVTAFERISFTYFNDTNWNQVLEENSGFHIFFRAKNNSYPFVLCVAKTLNVNGYQAAIVINLNLEKFSQLEELKNNPYQEFYLVSDEAGIMYRSLQKDLAEPTSLIPELVHYKMDTDHYIHLIDHKNEAYNYAQLHSREHNWSYVLVTHLEEYTTLLSSQRALFLGLFVALFSIVLLISFLLAMHTVRPIQSLLQLISNPEQTLSSELYNDAEIEYIANQITSYVQQNQALTNELSVRLDLLNHTKLLALQSQINPHFIFNTLDMIHIKECEALGYFHDVPKLTLRLSRLLHYGISSTDLTSLETELKFTKMYIELLKECYDNSLQIKYDIDDASLQVQIPKLFIQPFVENAVFHGLSKNTKTYNILTLSCRLDENLCTVSIEDNGVGISPEKLDHLKKELQEDVLPKNSIGIKNVVTRMNLLYGDLFNIKITSVINQGTVFTLSFPLKCS